MHTDSKEDYKVCIYCNRHTPWIQLSPRTVYYHNGFSQRDVLQCQDCRKEEMSSFNIRFSLTPATWLNEAYESICKMIKEMCCRAETTSKIINYYDAVKEAYLINTPKLPNQYNPMSVHDYLLSIDVNDVSKLDKNTKALWEFTYRLLNTEDRIEIVNKDPDDLLVSWKEGY